jgi:hypothetical protein
MIAPSPVARAGRIHVILPHRRGLAPSRSWIRADRWMTHPFVLLAISLNHCSRHARLVHLKRGGGSSAAMRASDRPLRQHAGAATSAVRRLPDAPPGRLAPATD